MHLLLTLILAATCFRDASALWISSSLFTWLTKIESLSPVTAKLLGTGVIWPLFYGLCCFALVGTAHQLSNCLAVLLNKALSKKPHSAAGGSVGGAVAPYKVEAPTKAD